MEKKVKVLHVLGEILPSGAETMLACAADVFAAHGISNSALSTGRDVGSFAPVLEARGFKVEHLPFAKSPTHFAKVRDLIRRERFDAVHIHCERAFFHYCIAARLAGCRCVIRTVHHIFPWSGWLRLRSLIQRQIARCILGVTFVSNSPSGQKNERLCYLMKNILIPNWYDSQKFTARSQAQYFEARRSLEIPDETFVLVSLGGNSSYKNYVLVIEAVSKIPAELPLLYLQVGTEGDGLPLSSLVNRLGLVSRVKCCGRVDDSLPLLRAADAYIMPSNIEGFGVAAAEGMAVGVPAILSHRPALQDFSAASDQILWVECDADSIASKILELQAEPAMERWARGQKLAEAIPGYCGLDVGPVQFARLYRTSK